jgi:hypothetical protein
MNTQSGYIINYCRIQAYRIGNPFGLVFQSKHNSLNDFLLQAYDALKLDYPKYFKMDRLSKLGLLASEIVLENHLTKGNFEPESVAIVLANAHSSLDTDLQYQQTLKTIASPSLFVYTLPNIIMGEISIRQGIKGEGAFFISERFDAGFMSSYVSMVLEQPQIKSCVAGWIDVLGEHHDVFLYLVQKTTGGVSLEHTEEQLKRLYTQKYGAINGDAEISDY